MKLTDVLKAGGRRFIQGVCSAPREFFAPAVVIWRGLKFVYRQLDDAMESLSAPRSEHKVQSH